MELTKASAGCKSYAILKQTDRSERSSQQVKTSSSQMSLLIFK